jgi:hypothetical protein
MSTHHKTILVACVLLVAAQASWGADVINMPDATLAGVVRSSLGLPADAPITNEAMLGLTRIWTPYPMGITSLEGLEYATNLRTMHLPGNPLEDCSPIANLQYLDSIGLNDCGLHDISFALTLPHLESIEVDFNLLTNLPAFPADLQLTRLSAMGNQLQDITPLTNLTSLIGLNLDDNPLGPHAYDIDIPLIRRNNPMLISFIYDPVPEPVGILAAGFCFTILSFRSRYKIALQTQQPNRHARNLRHIVASTICIGPIILTLSSSAFAHNMTWVDGNGSWHTPSNWNPSYHEPQSDDIVSILNGGKANYNDIEQADHAISYLTINCGAVDHLSCTLTIYNDLSIATDDGASGVYTMEYPRWYNIRSQLQSSAVSKKVL